MSLPDLNKQRESKSMQATSRLNFTKMHGAGNDFVVLDLRELGMTPDPLLCSRLADRHRGVGCDLILGIGHAASRDAVASYQIWTADGLPSLQCGNGARCVASWLHRTRQVQSDAFILESPAGSVEAQVRSSGEVQISLPAPQFAATGNLIQHLDLGDLGLEKSVIHQFFCVSTGNPHVVLEVDDLNSIDVKTIGAAVQNAPQFPSSACVGFAQLLSEKQLALRVFEFGAGETLACGTGACAAAAGFMKQGRLDRHATVTLAGGDLNVSWAEGGEKIYLEGPAEFVFEGVLQNATIQ